MSIGDKFKTDKIRLLFVAGKKDARSLKHNLATIDPTIQIYSVESATEAQNRLKQNTYDCIILDNNIEHAVKLASAMRTIIDVPILLLTDHDLEEVDSSNFSAEDEGQLNSETTPYKLLARQVRHAVEKRYTMQLYVDVAERSKDAIVVSVGTVAKYANPAAADLIGATSPEEILGKDLLNWINNEERPKLCKMVMDSTKEKLVHLKPMEITLIRNDGRKAAIEATVSSLSYAGAPAFLIFMRNIDSRRAYENSLRGLHDYAIKLNKASTQEDALNDTFEAMTEMMGHKRCSIATVGEGYVREYLTNDSVNVEKLSLPLTGLGIATKAARLKKTVVVQDTSNEPEYIEAAKGIGVESKLAVPVLLEDEVKVILSVERSEVNGFSMEDVELLEILASHLSQSLGMIEQVKERQAAKDIYKLIEEE